MKVANEIPASAINAQFFEKIASGSPESMHKLGEAATDYTRLTLREEVLVRKVLPPQTITVADLDKQLDTDKPVKLVDKEVNQPLSATVPFGTLPRNFYMRGSRYRVDFARLVTRNYVADVSQLETYDYDIRNTFKENAIKDMGYAEDIPFWTTVDQIIEPETASTGGTWASPTGGVNTSPMTGKAQKYDFTAAHRNPLGASNGFTRENFIESFKILQTGFTPSGYHTAAGRKGPKDDQVPIRLKTEVCVMNINTALEFAKWNHDEFGGPGAEDKLKSGITEDTWMGRKFIFTSKDDIIADGEMYMFAAPEFLGKFYELNAPTMFVDKHAYLIEFFIYSCVGCSIGNPFALAKAKFF